MAITDGSAVAFCNNRIRPLSDKVAQAYYFGKTVLNEWNANSMSGLIPNTTGDMIDDGSPDDGRHALDGATINAIISSIETLVGDFEANDFQLLNIVLTAAVNPVG